MKQLAANPVVVGINPAAISWLVQNRASAAIALAALNNTKPGESMLQ